VRCELKCYHLLPDSPHALWRAVPTAASSRRTRSTVTLGLETAAFAGHSLRAGFVTSAVKRGANLIKITDVTGHRSLEMLKTYSRDAEAFVGHAGAGLLEIELGEVISGRHRRPLRACRGGILQQSARAGRWAPRSGLQAQRQTVGGLQPSGTQREYDAGSRPRGHRSPFGYHFQKGCVLDAHNWASSS
jgi:hypothetical protein